MEFCPECGKALTPSKAGARIFLACKRCGYKKPLEGEKVVVKREKPNVTGKNVAAIIESEESPLPTTSDVMCPVCGYNEAKWWTVQTRSADEPMTQFFRCVKCGHTWREYA